MPPHLAGSGTGATVLGLKAYSCRSEGLSDALEMKVLARAPSNVALVKYWGKRDLGLNIPATGSISVTLDGLETRAWVEADGGLDADDILIEGRRDEAATARVRRFLGLVRRLSGQSGFVRIESANNFPTGAGLASSASAFAALAVALDRVWDLGLDPAGLSILARRGSGSAARSLVDGYAEMAAGTRADGTDAFAVQLAPANRLPLEIVVAVTTRAPKTVSSTEGMTRTKETSPFHAAWLDRTDLKAMREAVLAGDLERVGTLGEQNALRMHASMLAAVPPLLYWLPATVGVIREVQHMRAETLPAWVTIDAGPQVKVLCEDGRGDEVEARLKEIQGVEDILRTRPGRGASIVEDVA